MQIASIFVLLIWFLFAGCDTEDIEPGEEDEIDQEHVNSIPIAHAGSNQRVLKNTILTLDGSNSEDPDKDPLTYIWSFVTTPAESKAFFSDSSSVSPRIKVDVVGVYEVKLIVSDGKGDSEPAFVTYEAYTPLVAQKVHGFNFSPYMDGQDPNRRTQISEQQLWNRMVLVAPFTQWVRTYGTRDGLELAGGIAHQLGLKSAVGAWLGRNREANNEEATNLITAAKAGDVDLAIVGSEVLLRGDLPVDDLVNYIADVKAAIPDTIPVTTAAQCDMLLQNPEVISAVDVLMFNKHPYWDGTIHSCAVSSLHGCYQRLQEVAEGKPIILSETGWPSCGNTIGGAFPSLQNAGRYFLNVMSWARANNTPSFYFASLDEEWKARFEGPQGACWGVWDKEGNLKQGMQAVFDGETLKNNWSNDIIPGGPGSPMIDFTFVPALGSFDDLNGQALHVRPAEHYVVVYIRVSGRWWIKPFADSPKTKIACNGSWTVDITTGGIDERATTLVAFLMPNGYNPPVVLGRRSLPSEIDRNALAKAEANR